MSWRSCGHGTSFPTIVAAGPGGSSPHAQPSDREIGRGETVVVDAGRVVDSYCSDCTRTFAVGDLDGPAARSVRPLPAGAAGGAGGDAGRSRRERRRCIRSRRRRRHPVSGTFGHGLGLLVHEAPVARPESTDTLEPGNVLSCEPGINLAGEGGIRIEDMVLVTDGEPGAG